MKKLLLVFILFIAALKVNAQADTARTRLIVSEFEKFYNNGESASIYKLLTDEGKKALPLDNTKQFITQLKSTDGKYCCQ